MTNRTDVSVVIPYFDDQPRLTLLLQSLDQQEGSGRFEVIVADDGSPEAPVIPAGLGYPCTVVRQPNIGFRAAAARNLGAAAAAGELLMFLDGDTFPTSRYLAAMTRTLRLIDQGHGVLVVGRRRHADLRAVDGAAVLSFLRGESLPGDSPRSDGAAADSGTRAGSPARGGTGEGVGSVPGTGSDSGPGPGSGPASVRVLADPHWLLDGYARTRNLRSAGDEDFRLIISAVLAVDRRLWAATGGFDEEFVQYGGEDWDFGWRAWLAGAELAHEPDAVAWHDGPDAGGRSADPTAKNSESLRLARSIALPSVRGNGLVLSQPEIVVRYLGPTAGDATDAAAVACVAGLLEGRDAAVWFPGCVADPSSSPTLPPLLREDPRVHEGDVPARVLDRARFQVWVDRPVRLTAPLHRYCELGDWAVPGLVRGRRTRSMRRNDSTPAQGVSAQLGEEFAVLEIPGDVSLERWWAGW